MFRVVQTKILPVCRAFLLLLVVSTAPFAFAMDSDGDSVDDAIDVDDDGDGLIEIASLTELDHMRNNLLGTALNDGVNGDDSTGCGDGDLITECNGYELITDLDFNTDTSDAIQVIDSKDQFFNAGAGWEPVGTGSFATSFRAIFEGNNHTISNLFINNTNRFDVGLFGSAISATVQNLHFDGPLTEVIATNSTFSVGTLAGVFRGTVTNVHAEVNVGGIVTAGNSQGGGLIGLARSSIMNNLSVEGTVNGNVGAGTGRIFRLGGLIGLMQGGSLRESWSRADVSNGFNSGGLIGSATPFSSTDEPAIERCFASGSVTDSNRGGGFIGDLNSSSIAPGVNIVNAHASGSVSADTAGGFFANFSASGNHTITNSFATGQVNATGNSPTPGGFSAFIFQPERIVITDSYWDTQTTGQNGTAATAVGLTTDQLQCPVSNTQDCADGGGIYTGWPSDVWDFGVSIQYPALVFDGVVQRDTDNDGMLDSDDVDDDGDGILDATDLCPFDADAANTNFDADDRCDASDLDDDNDGYSDIDENSNGGQSDPFSAVSFPADNDNDFISDFNDPDDDNDGYSDIDELSNNGQSDPFNAASTPPDQDGDFLSDFLDDDDDNDTVPDADDNCPLDADLDNINTDGDEFCNNNDLDDDDDTVADGDDNCPLTENLDQANNDNDAFGNACDPDDDNDGDLDGDDNCPLIFNSSQFDQDNDGFGNACDVDDDGDQLIEVRTIFDLDAMRTALDGSNLNGDSDGCSDGNTLTACNGYELSTSIDFNTDTSDAVQVIDDKDLFFNGGAGWQPIGTATSPFTARFHTNGAPIRNLFINNSTDEFVGFFGVLEGADIQGVSFVGDLMSVVSTRSSSRVGTLAGSALDSNIVDANAVANVSGSSTSQVGGLFGQIVGQSSVDRVFTRGSVTATGSLSEAGGMAGRLDGEANTAALSNSYSDASVSIGSGSAGGGLVAVSRQASISNSYTVGQVTGAGLKGALVANDLDNTVFADSYWDSDVAQALSISSDGGEPKTTAQLQCVTNANPTEECQGGGPLFENWLGQRWNFGASFQYPVQLFLGVVQRDTDGDGILDGAESDPDDDGFEFGDDNCPFDQDLANINSDDDDQCDGRDTDDDNDGYTDTDEVDNGTDTTDAASTPPDNDGDFVSDLNDQDDDNDGNLDALDNCVFDADASNQNNDGDELCDTNDPDDDNDGVSDEREIAAGLDPFTADNPAADSDGDGFTDLDEAQLGSDVFDATITPLNAGAGFNEWNSTGPNGGGVSILVADPSNPDTTYALAGGEVYRTLDRGQNWRRITDNINPTASFARFFGFAIDPNDSDTLYVSNPTSQDRVFKTVNGGDSWQVMDTGLTIQPSRIIADPISSDILYVVDGSGSVFQTTNAGVSWAPRGVIPVSGSFLGDLVISPQNAAVIYSRSSEAVYVSSDGGATWNEVNTGLGADPRINDIAVDPNNADVAYVTVSQEGIFKTTNRGQNWSRVDTGTPVDALFPDKIEIDASDSTTLYFMNGLGVYKSIDGGTNWSAMFNGLPDQLDAIGFSISPVDPSTLFVSSTSKGVFLSENGAASWLRADDGIHRLEIDKLRRIAGQNEVAFATRTGNDGMFNTMSAGARWDNIGSDLFGRVFALAIDPENPDIRYAGADGDIFKSTDGGANWAPLSVPFSGAFDFIEVDRNNPSVVYARGQNSTLIRSSDGGATWLAANVGLPSFGFSDVGDLLAANDGVYFALSRSAGGVYKSTNQGALWVAVNNGDLTAGTRIDDLAADFTNNRLYAITSSNILLTSNDAGNEWLSLDTAPSIDHISVDQEAPEILLGASFGNYFRSADGGVSWQDLPSIVRDGASSQLVSGPAGSSVIYNGTARLGVHVMELATDLSIEFGVLEPQVVAGQNFTYRFTITNNGPYDESRAEFKQTLSPFADDVAGAVPSQGMCMPRTGAVECDLGLIKVGESVEIDIEVNAERAGLLNSRVVASGYLSTLKAGNSDFIAQITSLADTDGDEIPDVDDTNDDNDNFPDANDNCPLIVNNSQADLDGDGQGDVCDADQDGDGISDTDEQRNGLNPRNPDDANLDFDNDGLNNREEIALRTDIRNPDTDGDGVDDGAEVANGTDPRRDESKPIPISAIINLLLD